LAFTALAFIALALEAYAEESHDKESVLAKTLVEASCLKPITPFYRAEAAVPSTCPPSLKRAEKQEMCKRKCTRRAEPHWFVERNASAKVLKQTKPNTSKKEGWVLSIIVG